jgi:hypothetical protein
MALSNQLIGADVHREQLPYWKMFCPRQNFCYVFCSTLGYCVRKRGADPLGVGVLRMHHLMTDEQETYYGIYLLIMSLKHAVNQIQ